ncbi:hypothetical protein KC322_g106 [Hortaea werneckii]|nr:hypothetical protein KC322_g106 [Hortaea werneckii]
MVVSGGRCLPWVGSSSLSWQAAPRKFAVELAENGLVSIALEEVAALGRLRGKTMGTLQRRHTRADKETDDDPRKGLCGEDEVPCAGVRCSGMAPRDERSRNAGLHPCDEADHSVPPVANDAEKLRDKRPGPTRRASISGTLCVAKTHRSVTVPTPDRTVQNKQRSIKPFNPANPVVSDASVSHSRQMRCPSMMVSGSLGRSSWENPPSACRSLDTATLSPSKFLTNRECQFSALSRIAERPRHPADRTRYSRYCT